MTRSGADHSARRDERRLIDGVLGGDERAFRQLYRAHTPYLFRLALRLTGGSAADAEDTIQEAWRRAVDGLARFEGRSALRSWLRSIVVHCAWELLRRRPPASEDVTDLTARPNGRGGPWTRVDLASVQCWCSTTSRAIGTRTSRGCSA